MKKNDISEIKSIKVTKYNDGTKEFQETFKTENCAAYCKTTIDETNQYYKKEIIISNPQNKVSREKAHQGFRQNPTYESTAQTTGSSTATAYRDCNKKEAKTLNKKDSQIINPK